MNARVLGVVGRGMMIGLVALVGCAQPSTPPAPMPPPNASVTFTHFAGTPLSGPRPIAGAVLALPAIAVDVEWLAVERLPADDLSPGTLTPVGSSARLVLATRDRQPVLSTSRLTSNAQWASGSAATALAKAVRDGKYGQVAPIASYRTAVPAGITLDARAAAAGGSAAGVDAPVVDVLLQHIPPMSNARAGTAPAVGGIELTLAVQDYAFSVDQQPEPAMNAPVETKKAKQMRAPVSDTPTGAEMVLTKELAVLPPVKAVAGGWAIVIVLPSPFMGSSARAMVAVVRASPAVDNAPMQKLLVAALADVRRQSDIASGKSSQASSAPSEWPGYESALAALDRPDARRRAMAYLASQTGAALCGEIALSADDAALQQLAADIRARSAAAAAAKSPSSSQALGWLLDRACLEWCARLSGENRLPPEIAGVLSTYAGEAGRRSASLEELVRGTNSRASLETRLITENLIFLEDSSPSSRVRALDWLAARGRAPAGYDPLGPPRNRREALERATESASTRPSTPPPPSP